MHGIAATIEVDYDYDLNDQDGQLVQSVYIRPDDDTFVEFGYVQRRINYVYGDPIFFFKGCNHSSPGGCTQYDFNNWSGFDPIPEGQWQIAIYKVTSSPNTFRFWVKNAITGTKYIAPQTWSTNGTWNNGVPYTAQEIAVDDSATQDEVGNRHDNVWLMNSAMDPTGWLAATGNYGLAFVNNSTDYYGLTIHVGLFSGDSARYPLN